MKRRPLVIIFVVGLIGAGLFLVARLLVQVSSPQPAGLGVNDGALGACPDSPNCVSTYSQAPYQAIEPLTFSGAEGAARQTVVQIISSMPRSKIITNEPRYIHAEFRSLAWGFVDDVEFYLDESSGMIHNRSAARLGYDDLGVNRQRYEAIKAQYLEN